MLVYFILIFIVVIIFSYFIFTIVSALVKNKFISCFCTLLAVFSGSFFVSMAIIDMEVMFNGLIISIILVVVLFLVSLVIKFIIRNFIKTIQ